MHSKIMRPWKASVAERYQGALIVIEYLRIACKDFLEADRLIRVLWIRQNWLDCSVR